jgi:hypothetical protein
MRTVPLRTLCLTLALACTAGDDDVDTDETDGTEETDDGSADDTDDVTADDTDDGGADDTDDGGSDDTDALTAADLLADGKTVQEVLDAGYTPLEVYEADASLLTSIYGSLYQGGYIFQLDTTTGKGLVSDPGATRDQSPWSGMQWGCPTAEASGADGTAIGTGAQNTTDLTTACSDTVSAAYVCANLTLSGYSDWFLPSRDELALMYTNLKNNGNKGNLHANTYWSSSEVDADTAYAVFFATGSATTDDKTAPLRIRAVRAF